MSPLRRRSPILAFGLVAVVLAACSAAPDDQATATTTSPIAYPGDAGNEGDGGTCSASQQGCSVAQDPNGWTDAVVPTNRLDGASIDAWITAIHQAGCTTPATFTTRSRFHFWVQTCPESVSSIPVPPVWGSFSRLVFTCTACMPAAPAGYVNIGWLAPPYPPASECSDGACAGLPGAATGAP